MESTQAGIQRSRIKRTFFCPCLFLVLGDGLLIEPQIRRVEFLVKVTGVPGEVDLDGKIIHGIFLIFLPKAFFDEIINAQEFFAPPDSCRIINRNPVFTFQSVSVFMWFQGGNQMPISFIG
jgi:hypothetical protein